MVRENLGPFARFIFFSTKAPFLYLPPVLIALFLMYWLMRKQFIKQYSLIEWKKIRLMVLISLIPILFTFEYILTVVFGMGVLSEDYDSSPYFWKIIFIGLCSIALFSLSLWKKNAFSIQRIIRFIASLLIGLLSFILVVKSNELGYRLSAKKRS